MVLIFGYPTRRGDGGGCLIGGFMALCFVFLVFFPSIFDEMARNETERAPTAPRVEEGTVAVLEDDETLEAIEQLNRMDTAFLVVFNEELFKYARNRSDNAREAMMEHERRQKLVMLEHHIVSRTEAVKNSVFEANSTEETFRVVRLLLETLASERAQEIEKFLMQIVAKPESQSATQFEERLRYFEEEVEKVSNLLGDERTQIEQAWRAHKENTTPGLSPECRATAVDNFKLFSCFQKRFVRLGECDCECSRFGKQRMICVVIVGFIASALVILQLSRCHHRRRQSRQRKSAAEWDPPFLAPNTRFGPGLLHQIPPSSSISMIRAPPKIIISTY